LLAKHLVERQAEPVLAAMGLVDAPRFSGPTPLNTVLWQVTAMTPDGYVVGEYSLLADRDAMRFQHVASQTRALAEASHLPVAQRLNWYSRGFMRAHVVDEELVVSDLRMGLEQDYSFNFVVARRENGRRQATCIHCVIHARTCARGADSVVAAHLAAAGKFGLSM
jgi:inner membrane protein